MVHSLFCADMSTVSLWHGLAEVFGGTTKRIAEVHVQLIHTFLQHAEEFWVPNPLTTTFFNENNFTELIARYF